MKEKQSLLCPMDKYSIQNYTPRLPSCLSLLTWQELLSALDVGDPPAGPAHSPLPVFVGGDFLRQNGQVEEHQGEQEDQEVSSFVVAATIIMKVSLLPRPEARTHHLVRTEQRLPGFCHRRRHQESDLLETCVACHGQDSDVTQASWSQHFHGTNFRPWSRRYLWTSPKTT